MADIRVKKKNEVYLSVDCDPSIAQELNDHFSFEVPNAKFDPRVRNRMWDGRIRLYSMFTKELYVGLLEYLDHFADANQYTVDYSEYVNIADVVTRDQVEDFCLNLNLGVRGEPLNIREYQIDAVYHGIKTGRCLLLSPTGSGKSLIIYCLMRWNLQHNRKQLIIVPTTSLCMQMRGDFESYSKNNGWQCNEVVDLIMAGCNKNPTKRRVKVVYDDGSEEIFYPSEKVSTAAGYKKAEDLVSNDKIL